MPKDYHISKLDNGYLLSYYDEPERTVDKGEGLVPSRMKEHRQAFKNKDELSKAISKLL